MKIFYYITLIFSMILSPLYSIEGLLSAEIAVLKEGTVKEEGIPGFLPNRIPSLFGRYEIGTEAISVWAVTEPLVFKSDVWGEKKTKQYVARYTVVAETAQIWIVQCSFPMREEMKDWSKWSFVFSFDIQNPDSFCISFIDVYIKRTEFFFSSVKHFSDLSFPATLAVAGNK